MAALRSGNYKRGRAFLRRSDDKFCCLGVLCELAVKAGVIEPPALDPHDRDHYLYGDRAYAFPPVVVQEWAGLEDSDPTYDTGREEHQLSLDNDDKNFSFSKIADRIERYL